MNDCPNGDVRDLLPDYLHERLDPIAQARIRSHLATCADCQAELALLGNVRRAVHARAIPIDISAIVAAIPSHRPAARRAWMNWRVAAGITVLVAGGSSLAVMRDTVATVPDSAVIAVTAPEARQPTAPVSSALPGPSNPAPGETAGNSALSVPVSGATESVGELALGDGSLTDLNDEELASLLKDIESLDVLPSGEVENSALAPIAPSGSARGAP